MKGWWLLSNNYLRVVISNLSRITYIYFSGLKMAELIITYNFWNTQEFSLAL